VTESQPVFAPYSGIRDPDGRFAGLPLNTDYIDGIKWTLKRDVSYRTDGIGTATARAGFDFDWASVPRLFWRIFPPAGVRGNPWGIAALFHDWLYVHQAVEGVPISREVADRLLREIMVYVGCAKWRAAIFYRGVRLGGWLPWRRNAEKNRRRESAPEGEADNEGIE